MTDSTDSPTLPDPTTTIDPDTLAVTAIELHDVMDLFKDWSLKSIDALEHAVEEVDAESDDYDQHIDAMRIVHSVYRRLVESEADSLQPPK